MKKQLLQFIFIFGIHSSYASERITLTKSTELNTLITNSLSNSSSSNSSFDSDKYCSFDPKDRKTYFAGKKKSCDKKSQPKITVTTNETIEKFNNLFHSFVLNKTDISEYLNQNNDYNYFTIKELDRQKLIEFFAFYNNEKTIIKNLTSYKLVEIKPNTSSWKIKDQVLTELRSIVESFEDHYPIINLKNTEREWKGYSEYYDLNTSDFSLIFNDFFSEILQNYICINSDKFYYIWRVLNDINKEFDLSIFSINQDVLTIPDKSGKTILMHLAFSKYKKKNLELVLKQLKKYFVTQEKRLESKIKKGKSKNNFHNFINVQDELGNTALTYAAMFDNLDFFDLLLENNADFNIKNYEGDSIAHVIAKKDFNIENASKNHSSILISFIEHGADLSAKNTEGKTAFYCAVEKQNLQILEIFIQNAQSIDIDAQDAAGNTPLHTLVKKSNPNQKIVDLLLENGANPTIVNNKNKNALMYFFKLNNTESHKKINGILKKLDSEILTENLNLLDSKGRNTLMNILKRINNTTKSKKKKKNKNKNDYLSKILEKIITKTNDLNIIDSYPENTTSKRNQKKLGNTALIYAVMNNNATAVKLLLEHGAVVSINHQNNDQKSALAYVCKKDYFDISGLLLDSGANLT